MTNLLDLQLVNPKYPYIYIFVDTEFGRDLVFKASRKQWNPVRQTNKNLSTERFTVAGFSFWWSRQIEDGWRIAK